MQAISMIIWENKYRYQRGGQVQESAITDTWQRVAKALAHAEKAQERGHWQQAFYRIMENYRFLPGGRILAGAGTQHKVTLLNCFVMDIAEDSLKGIFHALEEGALTLQQGGGVGYDFSVLRPNGATAKKTGILASGPVSFMRIWDSMCSILMSTGERRGAMMGVLRCDHPDIEEFVAAKSNPNALRNFNVSVLVTDAFMQAVAQDADWSLVFPCDKGAEQGEIVYRQWSTVQQLVPCRVYRKLKARELWQKIIRAAFDYAEPGVLFGDTINRMNNLNYCEQIAATNPCGEIPLPPYGACDLGAINLTQFIIAPFTANAKIQWREIEETVRIATRFLDNVLDVSRYPLVAQRKQAISKRRIGLGVTGLADAFVMLGMRYGSAESLKLARDIMKCIANTTWQASIDLAREKGVFTAYTKEYLHGEFVRTLDAPIQQALEKYGVRNSHHNTIAPTGTISLLANNVSNGIEPIFRAEYTRQVRGIAEELTAFQVQDYAFNLWRQTQNAASLPPAWIDAETLTPAAHLQIQGAVQPYIDNAISKTINIPSDFPFAKLADIYTQAYQLGLKGCTVFRPNAVTGSVLVADETLEADRQQCCQGDE